MDTPFETDFGYVSDTDAEHAVDEDGDESGIGEEQPEGPFNLAELEILAHRRREWTQAWKKEKAIILREIYKEFAKIRKNHNLSLAECQEKEEDDLTDEQLAAAHNITEKWNGPEGPSAEVQAW
ncbi:hypothetical protein PISMIDRAFT_11770 [Pisolithus microcarpus 441]|uniref:Clathrin light chain n=1 Tax=Pisolithus microcarpus 441 TaxID=765257 RepID=A0A0C9ZR20_9AGAM|nr:hypothetical protein PISMIDRAFT_11770 [Pisolithus microcarpus 441]